MTSEAADATGAPEGSRPLEALRQATREEHSRLESLLRLTDPMSVERYAEIVSGFASWLRAWEPRVGAALPVHAQSWFEARHRADLASADVAWLRDERRIVGRLDGAALADELPLAGAAAAWGSLYVIEGSALGARVIAPRIAADHGFDAKGGARYFHGFGDQNAAMWRDFRAQAVRELAQPTDVVLASDSARRTFESLAAVFSPLAGEREAG